VTALCSPTRAALLTGRNHHASVSVDRRVFLRLSPVHGVRSGGQRAVPEGAADERVQHGRVRQVAPDTGWAAGRGGPVRPVAERVGLRLFLGFLGGESGQWDPVITENNKTIGVPQGQDGKKYYFPDDMADKTIEWLHAVRAQDPGQAVVRVLLHRVRARAAPRAGGVGGQVQGEVRQRLGRLPGKTFERQKRWASSRPTRS
jgi:Arylsulfatase A and related enzymes